MSEVKIAPSILSADFSKMGEEIGRIEACGADLVHCDVMDGMFVPNLTFGPKMIADIRKTTKLPLDVHLMIVEPERYVDRFIDAGADYVTIHVEATKKLEETLAHIRARGCKCGMVLSPDTACDPYLKFVKDCDMVLIMSVYPGFGGQTFLPGSLSKLQEMRRQIESCGREVLLEVDGGVGTGNAAEIVAAGANVLVAGSAVFGSGDPAGAIRALRGNA